MRIRFQGGKMKKYLVPALTVGALLGLLAVLIWLPKSRPSSAEAPVLENAGEESTDDPSGERLITIESEGKPAQVCRVLREWQTEDGSTAQEVEVVDTGERMTLMKKSASTSTDVKPNASEPGSKP
jgi:hypothetical protein